MFFCLFFIDIDVFLLKNHHYSKILLLLFLLLLSHRCLNRHKLISGQHKIRCGMVALACLFDLILYVAFNNLSAMSDGSFWVEPVLSKDKCVLLKDTTL